jgi:branched-chain amino acid transport system permease protein
MGIDAMPPGMSFLSAGDLVFIVACLLGGLAAALAGYLVGLPSLRLRGDYLAIVTLGFGEIVRVLLQTSRPQITTLAEVQATPVYKLPLHLGQALGFNLIPAYTTLFWIYLAVCATVLVAYRLKYSTAGRAMLSIREDEIAAQAMGINTTRYKMRAFVLSSFFAGLAGALFAHQIGSINAAELGFIKSFDIIIIIVLGGLGSISGAVLAAALLVLLPEVLRVVAEYRMIAYALMLILIMILRPQGLLGIREIWELKPIKKLWRMVRRGTGGAL